MNFFKQMQIFNIFYLNLRKPSFNIEPDHRFYRVSPVFDQVCCFTLNPVFSTIRNRLEGRVTVWPTGPVFKTLHLSVLLHFYINFSLFQTTFINCIYHNNLMSFIFRINHNNFTCWNEIASLVIRIQIC